MKRNPRRINILFVNGGMYIGGAEMVIANLCRRADKRFFSVSAFFIKGLGEIGQLLRDDGFLVTGAPEISNVVECKYFRFLKLRRFLRQHAIDIVHSHDDASMIDASFCRFLSRKLRHVHTFHFGNYPALRKNSYILQKSLWRVPDRLVAVGEEQMKTIQKSLGIPDSRIRAVWNGVEESRRAAEKTLLDRFVNGKAVVIGTIASLTEQKGLTYLLETAFELKKTRRDFVFLIAGDGPLRRELERKSMDLGLQDTVFFLGWVPDAYSRIMPFFDIFFQPSLWEAMSVVVIEAMAAGKPIVATSVGENNHMICNGINGFIVEPKDITGFVSALSMLISDTELRRNFGLQGRRFYESKCRIERMVSNYEQIYLELAGKIQ